LCIVAAGTVENMLIVFQEIVAALAEESLAA
jgi:hypothetical protein